MKHSHLSVRGYRLLAAGGIVLSGLVLAMTSRAAPGPDISTAPAIPVQADPNAPNVATTPQPIAVQGLDVTHFVVVTREPRLVQRVNGDGRFVNMVLPVVTYYSVQNGHLSPIEHVHIPEGWRPLAPAP